MRRLSLIALAGAVLCGCQAKDGAVGPSPGRYASLGHYERDELWEHMARGAPAADRSAATLHDDSEILVVMDSRTGEVRQCGNYSGYCVRMNPWAKPPAETRTTPLPLARHRVDLEGARAARIRGAASSE